MGGVALVLGYLVYKHLTSKPSKPGFAGGGANANAKTMAGYM
jgi:hypothetical protein